MTWKDKNIQRVGIIKSKTSSENDFIVNLKSFEFEMEDPAFEGKKRTVYLFEVGDQPVFQITQKVQKQLPITEIQDVRGNTFQFIVYDKEVAERNEKIAEGKDVEKKGRGRRITKTHRKYRFRFEPLDFYLVSYDPREAAREMLSVMGHRGRKKRLKKGK